MARCRRTILLSFGLMVICAAFGRAEILHVPEDYLSIREALKAAEDGDRIEVGPGLYFENSLIVDKAVHLKSTVLCEAIIDGGSVPGHPVFVIRAAAKIEGFIIRNADVAILQRDSLDVGWEGRHLIIKHMKKSGVLINARKGNIGEGRLDNIIVCCCPSAFATNDARGFTIRNAFVFNCRDCAFRASNHLFFDVDDVLVWKCPILVAATSSPVSLPGNSRLTLGPGVLWADSFGQGEEGRINRLFKILSGRTSPAPTDKGPRFQMASSQIFIVVGDMHLTAGNPEEAKEWFEIALDPRLERRGGEAWTSAYLGLARCYYMQGRLDKALEYSRRAMNLVERTRSELLLLIDRVNYLKCKLPIYEFHLRLLHDLSLRSPGTGAESQAFLACENSKARSFLESLTASGMDVDGEIGLEPFLEWQSLIGRINGIQMELQNLGLPPQRRAKLLEELTSCENDFVSLHRRITANNPSYLKTAFQKPAGLERIQKELLNDKTALLEFFWGEEDLYAFLLTTDRLIFRRIPGVEKTGEQIENFLQYLTLTENLIFHGERGSFLLYQRLIQPFEEALEGVKKIIIIPDGSLITLPFEALGYPWTREGGGDDFRFLVEEMEISYADSASSVLSIIDRKDRGSGGRIHVLAVSCPGGNPCLQRPPGKAVEGRMERRASTASPPSLACQLSFLPYSRQEVEMISRIFGAGNTVLLEGESATEESIRSLELERFRLLHFATHALVDKDHWMRSSIVLLPDVEEGGEGLLQPKDIILWNLKADLVTLSSCQSGLGRIEAGEGVIGLAKVFHAAGASAVTASLWRILDKSTSLFMKDFYGGLYAGQRKSAALRRAKINMIRRGLDHPYYWGAFILYGDWNPLRRD